MELTEQTYGFLKYIMNNNTEDTKTLSQPTKFTNMHTTYRTNTLTDPVTQLAKYTNTDCQIKQHIQTESIST